MTRMLLLTGLIVCVTVSLYAHSESRQLSILIVDGINNHDWQAATKGVTAILTATKRFKIEVTTTPAREATQEAWAQWHPQFSNYDAVLVNFNGGHKEDGLRWPAEVELALEKYLRGGGGLIGLHAANNGFLNWPAWNEMIGLGWRDKTFGVGLMIDEAGKVVTIPAGSGMSPGHGPRHDFKLCVRPKSHAIVKDFPACWMHSSEQLTHGQHGPAQGLTILTYAWSKDSKQNEPLDWVRSYGKGRVYTTMLGHTWKNEPNPNYEDAGFQLLLARGAEWAASGRVTIQVPQGFRNLPSNR